MLKTADVLIALKPTIMSLKRIRDINASIVDEGMACKKDRDNAYKEMIQAAVAINKLEELLISN